MSGRRIFSWLSVLTAQALDDNYLIQRTFDQHVMLTTMDSDSGEVFNHIDANHDGNITQAELKQAMGHAGPAPLPHAATPTAAEGTKATKRVAVVDMTKDVLKATDANHDGIISKDELQQAIRDIFERSDTNHDGVISRAELQRVLTTLGPQKKPAKEHVDKVKSGIDGKKTAANKTAAVVQPPQEHVDKPKSEMAGEKTAPHKAAGAGNKTAPHKAVAHAQSSQEQVDKVKSQKIDGKEMAARKAAADARWEKEEDKLKSKIAGNATVAQHAAADTQPSQAAAYGDPHCRNIKGESFDIKTAGNMTMLQVPGFRLTAKIGHISSHDSCSPTVIKEVTVGGAWLGRGDEEMTIAPGDFGMPLVPDSWMSYFKSESAPAGLSLAIAGRRTPSNSEIFTVRMKVFQTLIKLIQRRGTRSGVDYFDMRVYKIAALGKDIGGLLGNDPHDVESAPSTQCLSANTARLNDAGTVEGGSTGRGMMSVAWAE